MIGSNHCACRPAAFLLACVTVIQSSRPVFAQCDYGLTGFYAGSLGANLGPIYAMTIYDDGNGPALIVAGDFDHGNSNHDNIRKWDGTAWTSLGTDLPAGGVSELEAFNNLLFASGYFGSPCDHVFILKWDGSTWTSAQEGLESGVGDFEVFDAGAGPELFATSYNRLYKWAGSAWTLVAKFDSYVTTLAVFDDGAGEGPVLFAGGSFTDIDGVAANCIARWNGETWSALDEGLNGGIIDLVVHEVEGVPALFAAGYFTSAGGQPTGRVAAWDGQAWHPVPGSFTGSQIKSLEVWDDGTGAGPALYMSATRQAFEHYRAEIMKWNGANWTVVATWENPLTLSVNDMVAFDDGTPTGSVLFVGGVQQSFGVIFNRLTSAGVIPPPGSPSAVAGSVKTMEVFDDGNGDGPALYAGGQFTLAGQVIANNVARWNGSAWSALGSGIRGDNSYYTAVNSLKVFDDLGGAGPSLYAAGRFSVAGGMHAYNIARWDGENWSPVGDPYNGTIHELEVFDDGSGAALYAGGTLGMYNGQPLNNIAKWDGSQWTALGSGLSGGVVALAVFDDGSGPALYAGGWFDSAGQMRVNGIARWDGEAWTAVGGGFSGFLYDLAIYDDGLGKGARLVAGGRFSQAGSVDATNIAQWNGSSWSPVGNGPVGDCDVTAMATFDDGGGPALYAADGGLSRWNGEFWANAVDTGFIFALRGFENALYVGGGASGSPGFSRWSATGTALGIADQATEPSLVFPDVDPNEGDDLSLWVKVIHGGPVTYQWRRKGLPLIDVPPFSGVFTRRLLIENAAPADEGDYDVMISNDCITIISNPIEVDLVTCRGDIVPTDGDGVVNIDDVLAVIGSWGWCDDCPADLYPRYHNDWVDTHDLLAVINAWGFCP